MPNKNLSANELIEQIVEAIQEKKGRNIVVADLKGLGSSVCDYFVICEGRSSTHINALGDEISDRLSKVGCDPLHTEGYDTGNWLALDYASVIVHIFDRTTREFYNLEHLWRDGTEINIDELLTPGGIGDEQ